MSKLLKDKLMKDFTSSEIEKILEEPSVIDKII